MKKTRITSIWEAFGNTKVATILVAKHDAEKITNNKTIKVGLVSILQDQSKGES